MPPSMEIQQPLWATQCLTNLLQESFSFCLIPICPMGSQGSTWAGGGAVEQSANCT